MSKLALFVKVRTRPGKRDRVWQIWQQQVLPHVNAADGIEVNCYCYDEAHEDVICFFEIFADRTDFEAANRSQWYAEYLAQVKPFLASPAEVIFADPVWAKGVRI